MRPRSLPSPPRPSLLIVALLLLCGVAPSPGPAAPATRPSPSGIGTGQAYERHVARLRARLPQGFTLVLAGPFVVVGDEAPEQVRARARGTVLWAVSRLKEAYFPRDPAPIIDVWLFRDRESYERHVKTLYGQAPPTPYGFYSRGHHALFMNIATGGGTLVHEIVHPFVEANFPDCPPWLNEGLGSLYEACDEQDGRIRGLTNWRLPILQRAIRQGSTVRLERLLAMDAPAFYKDDHGTHYAQARYLCYYLQEQGRLQRFYRAFSAHRRQDPTGRATLLEVLGERDLADFQARWEAWALGLTPP